MNPGVFHDFVSLPVSDESPPVCKGVSTDRESDKAKASVSGSTASQDVPNVSPARSTVTLESDEHRLSQPDTRGLHPVRVEGVGYVFSDALSLLTIESFRKLSEINIGISEMKFSDCPREHVATSRVHK